MSGGFSNQLAEAFKPHVGVIGGQIKGGQEEIISLLQQLVDAQIDAAKIGRPEWSDKWSYCDFSFTAAQATPVEFAVPVVVPMNEVWLVQSVILTAAATITITTDGGQLRGVIGNVGTNGIGGDIGWLPGEHILLTSSAACTGTVGVIRRLGDFNTRSANTGRSNRMTAGRSNTHVIGRDNLFDRGMGLYVESDPELRDSIGTERNLEPVVPVKSVNPNVAPRRVLDIMPFDPTDPNQ